VSWHLTIELEREADGRWIAELPALPGVLAYGPTEAEAFAASEALALRVLADRLERGEASKAPLTVSFELAAG
jgi:predicted RNase H-like HicB family nuclease